MADTTYPWFLKKSEIVENLISGESKYTSDCNLEYFKNNHLMVIKLVREAGYRQFDAIEPKHHFVYYNDIKTALQEIASDISISKYDFIRAIHTITELTKIQSDFISDGNPDV